MNGRLSLSTAFDGQKPLLRTYISLPLSRCIHHFMTIKAGRNISQCAAQQEYWQVTKRDKAFCGGKLQGHFHRSGLSKAFQHKRRRIKTEHKACCAQNARLCYMPHPIMTFTGCEHISMGKVNITESSELIFSEIYCCGRTAMGEEFGLKRFRSRTEIAIDGRADFIDNTLIDPAALPIRQKGFSRASPTRDLCISIPLTRQCWKAFTKPTTQATLTAHSFAPLTRNVA